MFVHYAVLANIKQGRSCGKDLIEGEKPHMWRRTNSALVNQSVNTDQDRRYPPGMQFVSVEFETTSRQSIFGQWIQKELAWGRGNSALLLLGAIYSSAHSSQIIRIIEFEILLA